MQRMGEVGLPPFGDLRRAVSSRATTSGTGMPLSMDRAQPLAQVVPWPIAWVAATATGSTTSNEIAAVMTSAMSVGRLRNSRCDSKRFSIGHIAMAITQAHAMAGMKSRITHSAITSSAATSTARETCCVRGRAARETTGHVRPWHLCRNRRFAQATGLREPPFYPSAPDRRRTGCARRASAPPAQATLSALR